MRSIEQYTREGNLAKASEPVEEMDQFMATMIVEGQWELSGLEPSEERFIAAAQKLIDTGLAWKLQGHFGRTCNALIQQGYCNPPQTRLSEEV